MSSKSRPKRRKPPKPVLIPPPENPTPSDFSAAIARTAVAQICHSIGFKVTQLSALESLTHVAINYLTSLAKTSASYAAKANRTDSNLFDFTNAVHDMSSAHGFPGASELHKNEYCLLKSNCLKDLAKFVEDTKETPFAWPIPRRVRLGNPTLAIDDDNKVGFGEHVPKWLPGFPEVAAERRSGEERWEDSAGAVGNASGDEGGNGGNESGERELGVEGKRGRVKFRIGGGEEKKKKGGGNLGLKMRNGVCRGGKRVS